MACSSSKLDPRCLQDDHLTPDRINVLVLHATKGSGTQAWAEDECIHRLLAEWGGKYARTAFDDLIDVLYRGSRKLTALGGNVPRDT